MNKLNGSFLGVMLKSIEDFNYNWVIIKIIHNLKEVFSKVQYFIPQWYEENVLIPCRSMIYEGFVFTAGTLLALFKFGCLYGNKKSHLAMKMANYYNFAIRCFTFFCLGG